MNLGQYSGSPWVKEATERRQKGRKDFSSHLNAILRLDLGEKEREITFSLCICIHIVVEAYMTVSKA